MDGQASGVDHVAGYDGLDIELMRRVASGDHLAFDQLVGRYWVALVDYALVLLDDADAAADIAQDTFVRVWQGRSSWRPSGTVRGYLFQIIRNLALDEHRRREVRRRWVERAQLREPISPATPAEILDAEELQTAIEVAVRAMPPRRREIFNLAHVQGLTYREIATVLGISLQTAANQLSRALAELQAVVAETRASDESATQDAHLRAG